ncbi:MAG: HAD family hydrolase [Bacteroidetes bacterium]|nr:HAD family hydrolase [Bacteroidota bacterium]
MNKCVFLDRDGVINKECGYVFRIEDFVFNADVFSSLKKLQEAGFVFIVITNQSGIAKQLYTHEDVSKIHSHLLGAMKANGIEIAEIYYCHHHPDVEPCICRKPDSGMIEKAIARFNIDASQSFFIGDKERDIQAAEKAGLKGFLIEADSPLNGIAEEIIIQGIRNKV